MASDPLLHIKDSYYFDVPRALWRVNYEGPKEMAKELGPWVVRNDRDYQDWESELFLERLVEIGALKTDEVGEAKEQWLHWQHADSKRHGRPFDQYIEDSLTQLDKDAARWVKSQGDKLDPAPENPATAYLALDRNQDSPLQWMHRLRTNETQVTEWREARRDMDDMQVLDRYIDSPRGNWSEAKTQEINHHLSGKVFIPQPFAELKNAYETKSGFGITRYMVIEVVVAILIFLIFTWLAKKISSGAAPKGRVWNLLESFLTFIKTDVVEKGIEPHESPKFMPLFWTIFFFILGCNLTGMIPWVGSPTATLSLTIVLAVVVFVVGATLGIQKFGVAGYLKNLCPELGLPIYLSVFVVPMVWLIEFFSLFIKHIILAVRLLMNMAAGHLVLLGIMGLAFTAQAASMSSGAWTALSIVSIVGTTILSFLELFVAFLQAYVFTLLAAVFVGSATHHH